VPRSLLIAADTNAIGISRPAHNCRPRAWCRNIVEKKTPTGGGDARLMLAISLPAVRRRIAHQLWPALNRGNIRIGRNGLAGLRDIPRSSNRGGIRFEICGMLKGVNDSLERSETFW